MSVVTSLATAIGSWILASASPIVTLHSDTQDTRDCAVALSPVDGVFAGTAGGLVWYDEDGRMREHLAEPQILGTRVRRVLATEDALWVGTDRGLNRIDWERSTSGAKMRLKVRQSWEFSGGVSAVAVDENNGGILVGTWGDGLHRYDYEDTQLVHLREEGATKSLSLPLAQRRITAIQQFDGELWYGAESPGLWRWGQDDAVKEGVAVQSLASDGANLVVGSWTGASTLERPLFDDLDIRDIAYVHGKPWLATYGAGVLSESGQMLGPSSMLDVAAIDSRGGRTCVGGPRGLWMRHGTGEWKAAQPSDRLLPSNNVSSMAYDETSGAVWLGTFDSGIARFSDGHWSSSMPSSSSMSTSSTANEARMNANINVVLATTDGSHDAWIGTARGLYRMSPDLTVSKHYNMKSGLPGRHVLSLLEEADGSLIVGTQVGLRRLRGGEIEFFGKGSRRWSVWSIARGHRGDLWLGTTEGLIHWRGDNDWTKYSALSGHLPDDWITSVAVIDTHVYVGTYAAGVVELDLTAGLSAKARPILSGRVNPNGLTIGDGRLWISTMTGLHEMSLADSASVSVSALPTPGPDITGVMMTPSDVWVGTRRGAMQVRRAD